MHEHDKQNCERWVGGILHVVGEDPTREGLKDTPRRYVKMMEEMTSGYRADIPALFTVFKEEFNDQIILLKGIEFHSLCEHHLLPFSGTAHIAYIPGTKVVGVSKLARLLDAFAKRLQIQERIGGQVIDALEENLSPLGAACIIKAKHSCMLCRGVGKQNSEMVTSAVSGVFRNDYKARAELMSLINA